MRRCARPEFRVSFEQKLKQAIHVYESLAVLESAVEQAGSWCVQALTGGKKLLLCGNGGSSSEAQHLAGELMGRYKDNRAALPAVALTADAAVITCIGNDYHFDDIFSRQVQALGAAGDVLIAFTTSGNSRNVVTAMAAARDRGLKTIAFLGADGGKARQYADCAILVQHRDTARVQEGHQFLMHALMDSIEAGMSLYLGGPGE